MDRDIYNVILEKLGEVKEIISDVPDLSSDVETLQTTVGGLSDDVGSLQTTVGGLSDDVGSLQTTVGGLSNRHEVVGEEQGSYFRFTDTTSQISIGVNPVANRLYITNGTDVYYYTLTPYTP